MGEVETQVAAGFGGLCGLDAFGQRFDVQVVHDSHQRLDHGAMRRSGLFHVPHEFDVEFEVVGRHADDIQQPRLAGAEVVVGQADPEFREFVLEPPHRNRIGHRRFVHLEHDRHVLQMGPVLPQLLHDGEQRLGRVHVDEHRGPARKPSRMRHRAPAAGGA
ncbi:MAG: hypothetical protein DWQ45_13690 [Planctomycetota bacterium]|nr:MAG: hypothetical protein DWQ41_21250 [Planctomycetota bacterium]REK34327.1 MAG: hypothetical protein DWQ45_13690 [Planctomycetota bacterium]